MILLGEYLCLLVGSPENKPLFRSFQLARLNAALLHRHLTSLVQMLTAGSQVLQGLLRLSVSPDHPVDV